MEEPLRSDEELAAVRIGPAELLNSPIYLAEYDPAWPALFEQERVRINSALGDGALLIEHVGSTSVPGLAAKPRIDIVLGVPDVTDEPSFVPPLEATGYVLRIRDTDPDHRVLRGPDTDVNLHVYSSDCPEIGRMVLFRDHLRANKADRLLYERTKRDLAQRTWKYMQHYADAKTSVVKEIMARADAAAGVGETGEPGT